MLPLPVFRPEEIACIERLLEENHTSQEIAAKLGLPHSTFRARLANSGYRVIVRRSLEKIVAIPPAEGAFADTRRED